MTLSDLMDQINAVLNVPWSRHYTWSRGSTC